MSSLAKQGYHLEKSLVHRRKETSQVLDIEIKASRCTYLSDITAAASTHSIETVLSKLVSLTKSQSSRRIYQNHANVQTCIFISLYSLVVKSPITPHSKLFIDQITPSPNAVRDSVRVNIVQI